MSFPSNSSSSRPVVVTGQQIGVGWTPALSVVKALTALVEADRINAEPVYWLADEDHDRIEVSHTVSFEGPRILRQRFSFQAPDATATGWLPWNEIHQKLAHRLWREVPEPSQATLRGHVLALGEPLWKRGLRAFSPTDPKHRDPIQAELERWRSMDLEQGLNTQAERLEAKGERLVLDPRSQSAWFSLDPASGRRARLDPGEVCPSGHWLSPGAALRPLMQSFLLPVTAVVLGPAERAYWKLCEPLWSMVGLNAPRIVDRPSVFVIPKGVKLQSGQLDGIRRGAWSEFSSIPVAMPSNSVPSIQSPTDWGEAISQRFQQELARTRQRLEKLDRRLQRDAASQCLGMDAERLRQHLFPLDKAQERVLPGIFWLRDESLLERMILALKNRKDENIVLVEET
jgi:bacillithiol synthase